MIVRFSETGVDEAHLVDMLAKMWEQRRHHLARLSSWRERERRLHQVTDCVFEKAGGVGEVRIVLLDRLAIRLLEFWLVIPCVNMARAAIDEDPNHALSTGFEMRRLGGQRIERSFT